MSDIIEIDNKYALVLAHHAYTKIENDELLSEAIGNINSYKSGRITRNRLDELYTDIYKKVLFLQRIEQMERENKLRINALVRLCDKTRIKSPSEIRFADDIFKRILSYCIDDDKFKVDTTNNYWLNKIVMKNVRVQPMCNFTVKIIDDITKYNKYKIVAELGRIKERIFSPQGQYSLYDSYTADIKFKYCEIETETGFYYVTRLEKRRDIVVKYIFNEITEDMYTYEYVPYVELPKRVLTNILSFITFNKTNYEYKRTIVIKDVKLKYLGVTMYDIVRGVFHGSAFEFNDNITKSDKFYHVIIDSYIPFSIERWKRCADHGYKECRVCRHTGPKYILFQHGINSTLLNNYYYICDIKFNKDDNFYVDTEQDSHPYFRYDPSVENVRPLLNSEFVQLKYSEKPNYVTNDIFNNYIKPYIIPSKPENLDDLYYPSKFTMKNVRVRYIQKFDEKMTKHDFFIVDNIKTTLKFMRFVEIYNTHITEIFRSDDEKKSTGYPYTPADLYESYKRREKVYKITAPYISSQQILIRDEYYICNVKYQRDQHDLCNFFAILEDLRPCE